MCMCVSIYTHIYKYVYFLKGKQAICQNTKGKVPRRDHFGEEGDKRNRTTVQANDNSPERNSAEEVTSLMLSKQISSLTRTGKIKRNRKP